MRDGKSDNTDLRALAVSLVVFGLEVADDHAGLEQTVPVVAVEALLA